jgi:putative DNA methylase
VLDPFCGGGSIPLEAQRLGLEAHGSDLNPVAVLITKALIEIPPKFAGQPPVNPESRAKIGNEDNWRGAKGLAEDVRYYGKWMRDEAEKRIGHLYPKGPNGETAIAWLWARTVRCPNPACGARMPLISSLRLSAKQGRKSWIEPTVDRTARKVRFEVRTEEGIPPEPPKIGRGARFRCLVCGEVPEELYIKDEGRAGRISRQLMTVATEGQRRRHYFPPSKEHITAAEMKDSVDGLDQELAHDPRNIWCIQYGLTQFRDLFTQRQLRTLTEFSSLIDKARDQILSDARSVEQGNDKFTGKYASAEDYADGVATYLSLTVSKLADLNNSLCRWKVDTECPVNLFARQTIPMTWDYVEANPFCRAAGSWHSVLNNVLRSMSDRCLPAIRGKHSSKQLDAVTAANNLERPLVATDPPYYDNITYADLSDFFYIWLRRCLSKVHPDIFSTLLVPKSQELIATPYRFAGSRQRAQEFFERGLGQAFLRIRNEATAEYPVAIFYAFKQAETTSSKDGLLGAASTGWETMLEGLLATHFQVTGTWPMRTEMKARMIASGTNALASSIVLVCRPRPENAPPATRQEFVRALRRELPDALSVMMAENVAPVDLAQATIGPGMAIYSRYSKVVEADGSPMRVRTALQIINQSLDEHLTEAEGDVDSYTRFALTWFEQRGMGTGPYGEAETIASARAVSVRGVQDAGILDAKAGKVRLLPRDRLAEDLDPATDDRLTDWEVVQHLIRALETEGETGAARLLAKVGERGEGARDLAYRLYGICERKKWAEEALAYNGLVVSWPEITRLASQNPEGTEPQTSMEF